MEIYKEKGMVDSAFLEGNAQNIGTYELVPDLGDPFVVGYHVPQGVGWGRGWDRGKRWVVPDICNITLLVAFKFHLKNSYLPC